MTSVDNSVTSSKRLHSLDAFRGLDMLCIIGLDALMQALQRVFPDSGAAKVMASQFHHAKWGMPCNLYDMIFPLFVFISGMAMAYSIDKRLEQGKSRGRLSCEIVKRGIILILLGLVYNGAMDFHFDQLRYPSVLGLIGGATTIAGLLAIWVQSEKKLVFCALGVLFSVGLLQYFGGDFTRAGCINGVIDRAVLPGRLLNGTTDPEGLLCVFSASFLAIAGYLTGRYMQRLDGSPYRTVLTLFLTGALMIAAASGLACIVPIIKPMWTPTFTMLAYGWGLVVFVLIYLVVDVWRFRKLAYPFSVIGFNALAIYIGQAFINFNETNVRLFGGMARLSGQYAPLVLAVTLILIKWWILYVMERNKVRIRIG